MALKEAEEYNRNFLKMFDEARNTKIQHLERMNQSELYKKKQTNNLTT